MYRSLALIAVITLLGASQAGCDPAHAQLDQPRPVTAGPAEDIAVAPGDEVVVSLEVASNPDAVDQTAGLILPAGVAVAISGRIATDGPSTVEALIQLGPRGGPWRTVAIAASPPVWGAVIVYPRAGEFARVAVVSDDGARVVGGDVRQTRITAVPLPEQ